MNKISFELTDKEAQELLKVLQVIYQNNGNTTVKAAIGKLHKEVKFDLWKGDYIKQMVYKLLSNMSGKTGLKDSTTLLNGLQISKHNIVYQLPRRCNILILKVAKAGKLPIPPNKITHLDTIKFKKVVDVTNLILNAYA